MRMDSPNMVFADREGRIMDFEGLGMVGRSGDYFIPVSPGDTIPLPPGSQLYVLPDRYPVGVDRETGEIVVLRKNPYDNRGPIFAVSTFLSAAHTQTYLAAWENGRNAGTLPLFAYTGLGWSGGFVTTALRTDGSDRQDPDMFHMDRVREGISLWRREFPSNRLVEHLVNCAECYGCPAALNMFQGREEGPLPTSPSCNARCVGCISLQDGSGPPSPQQRITFVPTPEEIAEVALKHITEVRNPVVSFGQGCEGEPLLAYKTIGDAIRIIRRHTSEGTINLNTNASMPGRVAELADAGLDSMRLSMNSARPSTYGAYFRQGYPFEALSESAREMKARNRFVSVNLFVFPGVTDAPKEVEALKRFVSSNNIDMIQWRNLNMDPDMYLNALGSKLPAGAGIVQLIDGMNVRRGYFNPYLGKRS